MEFEQIKKIVLDNWWCQGSPLAWTTENPGVGIGHMALEGQVGTFNLCWLMLQRTEPPPLSVYQNTNMMWAIMLSGQIYMQGRSLLEHASFKTLDEFNAMVLSYSKRRVLVDIPNGVPWGTLKQIAERSFT